MWRRDGWRQARQGVRVSSRRGYPSDLTDAQWDLVEDLLPEPSGDGRPERRPRREIVDAILYPARSGCPWRYLPADPPPRQTVYRYFTRWKDAGVTRKPLAVLLAHRAPPAGPRLRTPPRSLRSAHPLGHHQRHAPPDHPRTSCPPSTPPHLHLHLITISNTHEGAEASAAPMSGARHGFANWPRWSYRGEWGRSGRRGQTARADLQGHLPPVVDQGSVGPCGSLPRSGSTCAGCRGWGPARDLEARQGRRHGEVIGSHILRCGDQNVAEPRTTPDRCRRRPGTQAAVAGARGGWPRGSTSICAGLSSATPAQAAWNCLPATKGWPSAKASFPKRSPMRRWVAASGCSPSGSGRSAWSVSPYRSSPSR